MSLSWLGKTFQESTSITYHVPKAYIRDNDGSQVWKDAPRVLIRSKFEREIEPTIEELRDCQ